MKKIQQKIETNPLSVLRQAIRGVTPHIAVKVKCVGGSTQPIIGEFIGSIPTGCTLLQLNKYKYDAWLRESLICFHIQRY